MVCANIDIKVLDKKGKALEEIVVTLVSKNISDNVRRTNATKTAVMDQIDLQFSPHVLVVQTGTRVQFPNSDKVKHHVYSFSPANVFEITLSDQHLTNDILFNTPGIVELGCNVHDWMLGYIKVVDTPFFGITDDQGHLTIQLEQQGQYTLQIWHPLMDDKDSKQTYELDTGQLSKIEIKLNHSMKTDSFDHLDDFIMDDYE